ncbi:hypothetical protein CXG81DRAFT_24694 [Caulochytrium protostelioides]|uniref:21S rRNA pseudouridine(2819) synthase n=1 Tax=Caulochytrium protostelioides TaxID=1555241 RepID=A0A4P9XBZ2_9FUNG|nr:hypothetical protein CXG81DRAFT_24694 [Caulochytrium protostelioides]|eukprot:RKP02641.1 hypothetical protein CXG81DRAFT_24694 [Caulochytrium protostelioides]
MAALATTASVPRIGSPSAIHAMSAMRMPHRAFRTTAARLGPPSRGGPPRVPRGEPSPRGGLRPMAVTHDSVPRYVPPPSMSNRSARRWAKVAPLSRQTRRRAQLLEEAGAVSAALVGRRLFRPLAHVDTAATGWQRTSQPAMDATRVRVKTYQVPDAAHGTTLGDFVAEALGMRRHLSRLAIVHNRVRVVGTTHAASINPHDAKSVLFAGDKVQIMESATPPPGPDAAPPASVDAKDRLTPASQMRPAGLKGVVLPSEAAAAAAAATHAASKLEEASPPRRATKPTKATSSQAVAKLFDVRDCVIYKDEHIIVISKPSGMAVQPGTQIKAQDHLDALMREAYGPETRVVHRLDRWVSGVLLFARHVDAARRLATRFQSERDLVSRSYTAILNTAAHPTAARAMLDALRAPTPLEFGLKRSEHGSMQTITWHPGLAHEHDIQHCRMDARLVARWNREMAVVQLQPQTGRRHQLRAACAQILGAPIIGDGRYAVPQDQLTAAGVRLPPTLTGAAPARHHFNLPPAVMGMMPERVRSGRTTEIPILLHLRTLTLKDWFDAPGGDLTVTAPWPEHFRKLVQSYRQPLEPK